MVRYVKSEWIKTKNRNQIKVEEGEAVMCVILLKNEFYGSYDFSMGKFQPLKNK
jgi:hypothetical protein